MLSVALSGAALSTTTYSALLDTLVGKPQNVTLDPSTLPGERIRHPQLLGILLQLLPTATYKIKKQALAHLTQLCRLHRTNCDALLDLPGWQRSLLLLLLPDPNSAGGSGGARVEHAASDAQPDDRLLPMLQRLLQVLHAHALLRRPAGERARLDTS